MNFIAIDFETANFDKHSACSIGLIRYVNGQIADELYTLIKPSTNYFVPRFIDIHGITPQMIQKAPYFDKVWIDSIVPFLNKESDKENYSPFVAHNAGFDMGVLKGCLNYYNLSIPKRKSICTVQVARKVWRHLPKHNLPYLAEHFNITYDAHNALSDAQTCAKLFLMAAEENNASTTQELLKKIKVFSKPLT